MTNDPYDVAVMGGGPAGLAAAMTLARAGRAVVVLEKSQYDRPRPGETFGGDVRHLLEELGIWTDVAALAPVPFRGVQSAWGSRSLAERASIFHPLGEGWHVERAQFDHLLACKAARAGVVIRSGSPIRSLVWSDSRWRIRAIDGKEVTGRYLVEASGRGAPATAGQFPDRHWLRMDRQVALLGTLTPPANPPEPVLMLETVEEGWW